MSGGLRLGSAGCFHGVHLETENSHCSVCGCFELMAFALRSKISLVQLVMHT